jgi:hypothetical protein
MRKIGHFLAAVFFLGTLFVLSTTPAAAAATAGGDRTTTAVEIPVPPTLPVSGPNSVNPDASGYDRCARGATSIGTQFYKDRFHACVIVHMGILWYRCQGCGLIGEVLIRWIVSLTGKNGSQVLTAHVNSSLYKAWGYYIPTQTLAMGVDCINRPRAACSSNHPHGFTYTFLGWMRPHRFTLSFDTSKSTGGGDGIHNNLDHVNYHRAGVWEQWSGHVYYSLIAFRCDRAPYIDIRGGCAFAQVMETWTIGLSQKGVERVAEHIELAFKEPGTGTYPPAKDKLIPGFRQTGMPLTRLYKGKGYNPDIYTANHSKAVRACIKKWGPKYAQGGNDCDEYPFAGTFQGASRAKGRWWYSVMVLPLSQNRRAGALLGNWLTDNHILAGDKYWVEVTK